MKYVFSLIIIFFLVSGWFTHAQQSFTDIDNHEYRASIEYIQQAWVVKWYPDGSYWPDRSLTRAELTKIILEASVWQDDTKDIWDLWDCFPDVSDQRYARYICYAKNNGIVWGYPNGTFGPEDTVTIGQALKITVNSFDKDIIEWSWRNRYQPYLNYVHDNNLFSKYAINPETEIRRGMMAYLAHTLMVENKWTVSFDNTRAVASAWCEQPTPRWVASSVNVNWTQRSFITTVWKNYKHWNPIPLIFAFHGRTNSNQQVKEYYKIDRASWGNAIIVYPSWLPEWWPTRNWTTDWVEFFDELVDYFTSTYCIDQDQIFAMGHSLGAAFTNTLSCERWNILRATWSVWWWHFNRVCTWPTASLIMHNPEDRLASFSSGENARDMLLKNNYCWPETQKVWPSRGNCLAYTNCLSDAPVIRCPHSDSTAYNWNYYPHTWPDKAWEEIRDFFMNQ